MRNFSLIVIVFIFLLSPFFISAAATENSVDYICPPNSYLKDGLCYCNEGLVWNKEQTKCITHTENCRLLYGEHVIGRKGDEKYASYCDCEEGYVWNSNKSQCISYNQACRDKYGLHVHGDEHYCDCDEGYVWNNQKTACINIDQFCQDLLGPNAYGDKNLPCYCKDGYVKNSENTKCITYTESCYFTYGEHTVGRKGDKENIAFCDCEEGYTWNLSKSQCIPKFKAFVEYFEHFNLLDFIVCLTPILIWFLVVKLIIKFVFKTKLSIKKSLIFFGAGMVIALLAWFIEQLLPGVDSNISLFVLDIILVYGEIAVIEELAKFFGAYFILKRNKQFNEAIDAMIYLIVLALGFALVENILVVSQDFIDYRSLDRVLLILTLRFFGANLLHVLSSGIIGFFWTLKLVTGKKKYLGLGLILGILLHWVFNIAIINLGGVAVFLMPLVLTILLVIFFFTIKRFLSKFNFHKFQNG